MKYKIGNRVRIKSLDWYNENKASDDEIWCSPYWFGKEHSKWCGKVMTISHVRANHYTMKEDGHFDWTDEMIEGLVKEECPQDFIEKYCKSCGTQRCDRTKEYLNGCPYYNAYRCKTTEEETKPEPKFKVGDFVFSGVDFCAMKVIGRCYDEHWRYQIFDDVNEYWFFEKELKKVEIGDVVYSKVWKEKVIVREFCDDKFILVVDFKGKLLKSLPSLIKQIKEETKPKFKVGDKIITDTNMKGKIIEVVEEGWYRVEFEPHNGIPQSNGVVPEESMSLVEEEIKPKFKVGDKITNGEITFTILRLSSDRYGAEDTFGECGSVYFKSQDDWKIVEKEMKSEDELLDEYEELTNRAFKGGYEKCKSDIEINGFQLPEGYQFVDENGNVINTTKIILEKKHDDKLKLESTKKVREYWSEYTRIYIEIYDDDPNECVLTHLYTLEDYRQKGYGRQALSEAEEIAKELGCHTAYLKVETGSWMHNWYLRCGYTLYKNADKGYTWLTKNI